MFTTPIALVASTRPAPRTTEREAIHEHARTVCADGHHYLVTHFDEYGRHP
jgi:hypothetical protein